MINQADKNDFKCPVDLASAHSYALTRVSDQVVFFVTRLTKGGVLL